MSHMRVHARQRTSSFVALAAAIAAALSPAAHADKLRFDIASGPAQQTLGEFIAQTGLQLLFDFEAVKGLTTRAVSGELEARDALAQMLQGTGFMFEFVNERTVAIVKPGTAAKPAASAPRAGEYTRLAQAQSAPAAPTQAEGVKRVELEEIVVAIPEVLVVGSKILNMDIRRTQDDAQPYVILQREQIEQSAAGNVEEFLKQRLPMNTVGVTFSQLPATTGTRTQINLRGLGANQTLILIDGHRGPGSMASAFGAPQTDLSGIPLAAVERIEVLPTAASGIYGGNATGGVVNVVLRRDYDGAELKVTYDNTIDSDSAVRRVDFGAGFNLEAGKTNILLAGGYSDANVLRVEERDFVQHGRAAIMANNPGFLLNATTPPLGATTNIRSVDGSPLFGPGTANITYVPEGYAGGGGLAPFAANAAQYNLDLANNAEIAGGGRGGLLNTPTVRSLMTTLRREFGEHVRAFLEAGASRSEGSFPSGGIGRTFTVAATAPNNPFGRDIRVTVPITGVDSAWESSVEDRRVVGGLIFSLPGQWQAETDYTWHRSAQSFSTPGVMTTAAPAIRNGTLDVLRDTNTYPLDIEPYLAPRDSSSAVRTTLKDTSVRVSGPLGSLPAGQLTLSALLEHREEVFDDWILFSGGEILGFIPSRSQSVDSAYLELRAPIVQGMRGVRELELQIAGRYDDYRIEGATVFTAQPGDPIDRRKNRSRSANPTLGLRYQPVRDLTLRASYGTGFLPPAVDQLIPTLPGPVVVGALVDPRRGGTATDIPLDGIQGGNPDLEPEESESWSVGAIFTPRRLPDMRLSVDYTLIEKSNNITELGSQALINNEGLFPGRVTRGPNLPGDPAGWAGPITFLDLTAVNIARARVEAYDIALDYQWQTERFGVFDLYSLATWQPHYETQLLPDAPVVDNAGARAAFDFGIPVKWKANAGLNWSYRGWTLGWTTRYFDSYVVSANPSTVRNQGSARVPSQTYHDFQVSYRFDGSPLARVGFLAGAELRAGVRNVFNTEPPFDAGATGEYFYSSFGDPRLASYYLSLKTNF